jgi:CcdC protein
MHNTPLVSYAVMGVALVLIITLRMRRMGRDRPLKLERLWVLPTVFLVIMAVSFTETPPEENGWILAGIGLVIGGIVGWVRGRTIAITVDPATQTLNQRASPAALILLVVLLALRFGLRTALANQAPGMHLSATAIVDAFLALALGVIALQRLEMFLRGRKLLVEARAGR